MQWVSPCLYVQDIHVCVQGGCVRTHSRNTLVPGFPCVPRSPWPQLSMTGKRKIECERGVWGGTFQTLLPPHIPKKKAHTYPSTHHRIAPLTTPSASSPSTFRFLSRERLLFLTLSSSFSLRSCSARASKSLFLRRCLAACAMAVLVRV